MQTSMSPGLIIGIAAAGGVLILSVICVLLIRLILRAKHKRQMTRIATEIEGRLSRVPSSHMHISDDDVARMPGNNAAIRRSLHDYYHRSPYTPMSSRETLESRPVMKSLERVKSMSRRDREAVVPLQSWPLPRRLTRSDGTPLANLPVPAISPKKKSEDKEKSLGPSTEKEPRRSTEGKARSICPELAQNRAAKSTVGLKPKPLFHGQQRSISHGVLPELDQPKTGADVDKGHSEHRIPQTLPRARYPRSLSVCSQEPGAPPTHVLPPLPFEISRARKSTKSPTDFSACESLFNDNTSMLNDKESKIISDARIDLSSVEVTSLHKANVFSESTPKGLGLWNFAECNERASPIAASKALNLRPQLSTQKSFRGSIEQSRPRSGSSGLPLSLLDHASYAGSSTNSPKEASSVNPKPKISSPSRKNGPSANDSNPQPSPLGREPMSELQGGQKNKRAALSPLSPISGNEGSVGSLAFFFREKQPPSIAIDDHSQREPQISADHDNSGEKASQTNRQVGLRKSRIPILSPTRPQQPLMTDQEDSIQEMESSDTVVREPAKKESGIRPPSKPTFDTHLTPTCHQTSTTAQTPPFSPTLAMLNIYDGAKSNHNSSPESAISTPTKKPTRRASPNSRSLSSAFDSPFTAPWHTLSAINGAATESESSAIDPDSRPSSFLFNFPNPPKPITYPSWRGPKTPIRSLRLPPPSSHHSSPFRKSSRSPSRSPPRFPSISSKKSSPSSARVAKTDKGKESPGRSVDLRRSIMALRRQNSEVNEHSSRGSREHKRYLSIGDVEIEDNDSAIFDGEAMGEGNEGGKRGSGLQWSRTMPLLWELRRAGRREWEREREGSSMSFYDGEGFLRGE